MEDNKFDSLVKSMMAAGTEQVPEGMWDALQGSLPAAKKRTPIIIWIGGILAPVAVAAALALAFILPSRQGKDDVVRIIENGRPAVAEVSQVQSEVVPHEGEQPSSEAEMDYSSDRFAGARMYDRKEIGESVAGGLEERTECPEIDQEMFVSEQDTPAQERDEVVSRQNGSRQDAEVAERGEEASERESDAFVGTDRFDYEDNGSDDRAKSRVRASLTAYGDAVSNTGKSFAKTASGPMKQHTAPSTPVFNAVTETSESSYSIPVSFGVGTKIGLAPRWSIGVGVNYTLLSRTFAGNYREIDEDENIHTTTYSSIHNRQSYIGVPVNAYFSIIKNNFVDFYTYAGGTVEHCVANKYVMSGSAGKKLSKDALGGFQFSADAGLGVEFIVKDRVGFYLDPSVRYYFKGNHPKSIRTQQPLSVGFEAGMRIKIN